MGTRVLAIGVALVGALGGVAAAREKQPESVKNARAILKAQAEAIANADAAAFAGTFAEDGFAIFPDAQGVAVGRKAIGGWMTKSFIRGADRPTVTLGAVSVGGGDYDDYAWLTGELAITARGVEGKRVLAVRVTALVVGFEGGPWLVRAAHYSLGVGNAAAAKRFGGDGPAAPERAAVGDESPEDSEVGGWFANAAAMAGALAEAPGVSVLGTDAKEKALGKPEAKKLLGAWKGLRFEVVGGVRVAHEDLWGFAAANVNVIARSRKKTTVYPCRVLVIYTQDANGAPELLSVHFSLPAE